MLEEKKGDKQFKKGKQEITISVFNWSKDYASAASHFDQAYKNYKAGKLWDKAIKTLKQLVTCNQKITDSWAMARNYEAMVDIYLDNYPVDYSILKQTITLGFVQFRMADSLDKGLQMISRVTKKLQSTGKSKQAVQLMQEAYQIAQQDEKSFKKKQIFNTITQNLIENQFYEQAIKMYFQDIKFKSGANCDEQALIIIILYIIIGDLHKAKQELFQLGNIVPTWLTSNESESAENLINFYKAGEPDKFKKQTTKAAVTTLFPLVIIRKLRAVDVPSAQKFYQGNEDDKQKMIQKMF